VIDKTKLAKDLLRWEELKIELDLLEKEISYQVFALEESYEAGNVRAVLNRGRRTYCYETAARSHNKFQPSLLQKFEIEPISKIDWKAMCEYLGIVKEDIPSTQPNPFVKIELLEG
jgi:hypothetical protein